MRRVRVWIAVLVALVASADQCLAQSYRYMDEAGNIHFVDSIKKVPRKYMEQVAPPTPTPELTDQQRRQVERQQRQAAQEQQRQERLKMSEERQKKMQAEKDAKRQRAKLRREEAAGSFASK